MPRLMTKLAPLLSSKSIEWATPQQWFDYLNLEFKFTLDPCADESNAKCKRFFTIEDDGQLTDVAVIPVHVTTEPVNQAPAWTDVPGAINAVAGELIQFGVTAADPENDAMTITMIHDGIPDGYSFTDNQDGTASLSWQTSPGDEGNYNATFIVNDGEFTDSATVPIQVDTPPDPGTMIVSAIDLTENVINKNFKTCTGVITVLDLEDAPVAGVVVSAAWSGLYSADVQGTTDQNGQVTFVTEYMRNPYGLIILTITDLTKADWTYDHDHENNVTEAQIGMGGYAAGSGDLILAVPEPLPEVFLVQSAFPNPFNDQTMVSFGLPEADYINIKVFDQLGKQIVTLVNDFVPAGWHSTVFNAAGLPNGIYIVQTRNGSKVFLQRVVLLR